MTKRNSTSINSPNQVINRTVLGIGYDSGGKHTKTIKGIRTEAYKHYLGVLTRCYSHKYHKKNPTYIGCALDQRWHDFQVFAEWITNNKYYGLGYQLDKDLLISGNKIYSPETCVLIPHVINYLLLDSGAARGDYPQGVSLQKDTGRYKSSIKIDRKHVHLGYYDTPHEAHDAYTSAKETRVQFVAKKWKGRIDIRVFNALMNWTVN